MVIGIGYPDLVARAIVRILRHAAQRVHSLHKAVVLVICETVNPALIVRNGHDVSVSVVGKLRHKSVLCRLAYHASCTVIAVGNAASVCIHDFRDIAVSVIGIRGLIAKLVRHFRHSAQHRIVRVGYRISPSVHGLEDISLCIQHISNRISKGIRYHGLSVTAVIGGNGHVSFRICLTDAVVVLIVGISQGISEYIPACQDVVHLIVGKDRRTSHCVCNGKDLARRTEFVGGHAPVSRSGGNLPSVGIIGMLCPVSFCVRFGQDTVHCIAGILRRISFPVCHGDNRSAFVFEGTLSAVGIRDLHEAAQFVVPVLRRVSFRIRHGQKVSGTVVGKYRRISLIICRGKRKVPFVVGKGNLCAILPRLGQDISVPIVGVDGRYTEFVGAGRGSARLIIFRLYGASVRIEDFCGASVSVMEVLCDVSAVVFGNRTAVLIGELCHMSAGIRLFHNAVPVIVHVRDHAGSVLVVPGGHAVPVIILIASHTAFRIGHGNQIVAFIIGISNHISVRKQDLRDPVLLIHRDLQNLSARGCYPGKTAFALVLVSGRMAFAVGAVCQKTVAVKEADVSLFILQSPAEDGLHVVLRLL